MRTVHRIERITYKDDTERLDNIYSGSKGCVGNLAEPIIGQVLWFDYSKDNKGNSKSGYMKTSMVEHVDYEEDLVIVETLHSVYYFRKL